MTVAFGDTILDKIDYDRDADVLYLSTSGVKPVEREETPEGHVLRFDENGRVCGVTIIGLSRYEDDQGNVHVTFPQREELGISELDLVTA